MGFDSKLREVEAQRQAEDAAAVREQQTRERALADYLSAERRLIGDFLVRVAQPTEKLTLWYKQRWDQRAVVRQGWVLEASGHEYDSIVQVAVTQEARLVVRGDYELSATEARKYLGGGRALAYSRGYMFSIDSLADRLEAALAYRLVYGKSWSGPESAQRLPIGIPIESTVNRVDEVRRIKAR
jgi:hypothetical protein